jgi:hypothetical protein
MWGVLLPVREVAAVADGDFAEARAGRPHDSRRDAGATVRWFIFGEG